MDVILASGNKELILFLPFHRHILYLFLKKESNLDKSNVVGFLS